MAKGKGGKRVKATVTHSAAIDQATYRKVTGADRPETPPPPPEGGEENPVAARS